MAEQIEPGGRIILDPATYQTPSASSGGERRQQALEATLEAMAERGYDHTRFADVSAISGIPVSTLQYYFGTRQAMLLEAIVSAANEDISSIATASVGDSPIARIEAWISAAVADDAISPRMLLILIELARISQRDATLKALESDYTMAWRQPLAAAIADGVADGSFTLQASPGFVTRHISMLIDGLCMGLYDEPDQPVRLAHKDALMHEVRRLVGLHHN